MFFRSSLWLIGSVFALEGMRRGFMGGSALSLFIIKEFGLQGQAVPTLRRMKQYLVIEEAILSRAPKELEVFLWAFTDYHEASQTYVTILEIMSEEEFPDTCEFYWKKGEQ